MSTDTPARVRTGKDAPASGNDDTDSAPDLAPPRPGHNLMTNPAFAALMRSRWYPKVFQVPVAAVFGLVAYQLLAGPASAHDNPGTALMWVLWWPALPVVFVLLGRFWCAVCPFGAISDLVQKVVGVNRPVPRWLKKYGIWIIDAQFLAITWSDHVFGIVESPWGSGVLLLLLTTAVIVSGAFLQRRAFCRYLCFLGGLCGNYGRAGMVELRADATVCKTCKSKAACFNGTDKVAGCPLFSFPRTLDTSADCSLCGNCIKSCPNDAIQVRLRKPASELWFIRTPRIEESFLAMAIMGIVLIQNVTMLGIWKHALSWIADSTGITNTALVFTLAFAVAVAAPVGLLAAASLFAARHNLENTRANFARFGYSLIPLDIAAHLAHNLFHLLAEGGSVVTSVAAIFGRTSTVGSTALVGTGTIHVLQFTLLAAGVALSIYTALRISAGRYQNPARRRATVAPFVILIVILAAVNSYLLLLPMAHRM